MAGERGARGDVRQRRAIQKLSNDALGVIGSVIGPGLFINTSTEEIQVEAADSSILVSSSGISARLKTGGAILLDSVLGLYAQSMVASGAGHLAGIVPDPGSSAGTTKYLREDATWVNAVSTVSIVTANGVSGTVATATSTPAITLTLGAITPSSIICSGDIKCGTVGGGLYVKEGTNATAGVATLSGGTIVVSTTKVTANSRIHLTVNGAGVLANLGTIYEDSSVRSAGVSFTISSSNILSNATVAWVIIEPA